MSKPKISKVNSRRSSTNSNISTSFKSLVEKYTLPVSYDIFATSYICREIPIPKIGNVHKDEDIEVESDISTQFPNAKLLPELEAKEKVDKKILKSVRTKHIISSSRVILRQIYGCCGNTPEDRQEFLYLKAKQWCEVTKAIMLDQRYPKIDRKRMIRRSSFHRKAANDATKIVKRIAAVKMETPSGSSVSLDGKSEVNPDKNLHNLIQEIIGDSQPLKFEYLDDSMQLKALDPVNYPRIPKRKQLPWKRNIYPPKTKEMRIQEMRELLPPPKPLHLQTDQLSGIWDPALALSKFRITGPNYNSRVSKEFPTINRQIDWYQLQVVKEKCLDWLSSDANEF